MGLHLLPSRSTSENLALGGGLLSAGGIWGSYQRAGVPGGGGQRGKWMCSRYR